MLDKHQVASNRCSALLEVKYWINTGTPLSLTTVAMGGACASTSDNNVRMCLRAAVNDAAVPVLRRVVKSVFTVALMAASVSRCALISVEELELGTTVVLPLHFFKRLEVRCCCRFFFSNGDGGILSVLSARLCPCPCPFVHLFPLSVRGGQ